MTFSAAEKRGSLGRGRQEPLRRALFCVFLCSEVIFSCKSHRNFFQKLPLQCRHFLENPLARNEKPQNAAADLWGIPETAPASAFGVLFGDSQEVARRVLPRVPGKLGVLQGVLPIPPLCGGGTVNFLLICVSFATLRAWYRLQKNPCSSLVGLCYQSLARFLPARSSRQTQPRCPEACRATQPRCTSTAASVIALCSSCATTAPKTPKN